MKEDYIFVQAGCMHRCCVHIKKVEQLSVARWRILRRPPPCSQYMGFIAWNPSYLPCWTIKPCEALVGWHSCDVAYYLIYLKPVCFTSYAWLPVVHVFKGALLVQKWRSTCVYIMLEKSCDEVHSLGFILWLWLPSSMGDHILRPVILIPSYIGCQFAIVYESTIFRKHDNWTEFIAKKIPIDY
jgi:hypothetical protein